MTEEMAQEMLELTTGLLDRMIEQQQTKVLRLAREVLPNLNPEDLRNAHDFPGLKEHPTFEFEDGILAGLISARTALRAEIKGRLPYAGPPLP